MTQPPRKEKNARAGALSARLSAVQVLYQSGQSGQALRTVVQEALTHGIGSVDVDGGAIAPPDAVLLKQIIYGVEERSVELETVITANLKKDASGRRIEPLLHAILMCGAYELLVRQDVDAPLIIDDYLNVSHGFYGKNEVALVNGVLDTLASIFRGGA